MEEISQIDKKVPQPLKITVLSSLSAYSVYKVYLELALFGRFLNGDGYRHGSAHHGVVALCV